MSIKFTADEAPCDVVHISSAHAVEDTRIFVKEARSLARAGYSVAVLAPGQDQATTVHDGVRLITLPRPENRLQRFTRFGTQLYHRAMALQPDVVHLHDPDLLRLRGRFQAAGVRVIYDMHEDYPKAMLSRAWLGPMPVRRAVAAILSVGERRAIARVDGVVIADTQLHARLPGTAPPHAVVRNYVDLSEWPPLHAPAPREADTIRCVYVGDISSPRGALLMCDAIAACTRAGQPATLDLIGPCPPDLQTRIKAHPAAHAIRMHGRLGRADVIAQLTRCDVGFYLLEPTPAYREGLGVKVLEYLMAGLPVVGTTMPRLLAEQALAPGLFLVDWDAPQDALVAAIQAAHGAPANIRSKMQTLVHDSYNWDSQAQHLLDLYQVVVPQGDITR